MRSLIVIAACVLAVLGLILALPTPDKHPETRKQEAREFAIVDTRIFDGQAFHASADIWVQDGSIVAMGENLDIPARVERIEGAGDTLLPGLIDAHVHTFGQAQSDALRFGVTTLLDMFTSPALLAEGRRLREDRSQSTKADLYSAGMLATARSGHGTQFGVPVTPVTAPEQAEQWVDARIAEGSDFIKIVIEPGTLWGASPLPTLNEDTVRALVTAAKARGLMALAHVSTQADAIMAIEAGVDGLVHVFADAMASDAFIELAKSNGVFVIPTAVVMAGVGGQLDLEALLAEPGIDQRISQEQRQSLLQESWAKLNGQALLDRSLANVRAMHEAGIVLLAGSDAPNPGTAHGLSLHHELELLVSSGVSPAEALASATSVPAAVFGLEGRGCLTAGCRADMVWVKGNPQTDIRTTRQITQIWKNGRLVDRSFKPSAAASGDNVATDLLAEGVIRTWVPADDRFIGGQSIATILSAENGQLEVKGDLNPGSPFPYSGAIWSPGQPFMTPVDLSDRKRLRIEILGESNEWMVMLFSGSGSNSSVPARVAMEKTATGAAVEIRLEDIQGFDSSQLQAIGIFAVETPREFAFTMTEARLE
ncbi:MAG: amidohydrolase family protein [Wenzhouxiangella sp.]|jgi:imidazolonepropionase-like amidohydrolase|nr:amidohydrolase family protein [Wenzhouxiangella sp.]